MTKVWAVWNTLLVVMVTTIATSCGDRRWHGFVYPDGANLQYSISIGDNPTAEPAITVRTSRAP